jgi:hypothetical protein
MLAEFYPELGNRPTESIRATGLINALVGAGFAISKGDFLSLTEFGSGWLSNPTSERFREGFWNWIQSSTYDEFSRISRFKDGFNLTQPAPRRQAIVQGIGRLPVGKWVSVRDFFRALKFWGYNYRIEEGKFSTLRATHLGSMISVSPHVYISAVQGRYLLVVLMEMLSAFGMIDLAFTAQEACTFPPNWDRIGYMIREPFSRYDGLQLVRLTPLGAFLLGKQTEYVPGVFAERSAIIETHPDLKIRVVEKNLFTSADRAILEQYCAPQGTDWYRLDAQRTIKSLEAGLKPADFLNYVERKSLQALPTDLTTAVERWKQRCNILVRGEHAVIFQVKNLEVMKELLQDETLRDRCWLVEEHQLAIPVRHEKDFIRRLHELEAGIKG